MTFYLGTHLPGWLAHAGVPLCVSQRRLHRYRTLPQARAAWGLDSGGFSELSLFGHWRTSAAAYLADVQRYHSEVGQLAWAATQDWMCEPAIRQATGLAVTEHQQRTTDSFVDLRDRDPSLPWLPVLQGWSIADYQRHRDRYDAHGIALETLPAVGLGTVCRRQSTAFLVQLLDALPGLKIHGFGIKLTGLTAAGAALASADSLAWSYHARRRPPLTGHTHASCANCLPYALAWRQHLLTTIQRPAQLRLPLETEWNSS